MAAVRIENLRVGHRRRRVLSDLSWSLGPGTVGLLGPNGAGKTTLINCLVGLRRPDAGTIDLGPEDQRAIGYVPQRAALPRSMTVRHIIEYHAWLKGVAARRIGAAAAGAIGRLDLDELADRRAKTLSGGQRQRVAIAAALVHSPAIVVLDEPTVGLDPAHRLAVRRTIKALESVETVLISTHLVEDVRHLCSSIGILNHGRLQFAGSVDDFLARADETDADADGSAFEIAYSELVEER